MSSKIDSIIKAEKENWGSTIEDFLQHCSNTFVFPELNEESKRKDLWKALYNIIEVSEDPKVIQNSFVVVKILSREKSHLSEVIDDKWIELIKKHAVLNNDKAEITPDVQLICLEVLRCLSNIFFNSPQLAAKSLENGILDGLTKRIDNHNNLTISDDIKFMDIRLFFLITALCPEARNKSNHMIQILIKILEGILEKLAENQLKHVDATSIYLTDVETNLVNEVLKVLFNLTLSSNNANPELFAQYLTLVKIIRSYLMISCSDLEKTWTLRNNLINLLTNMPDETYKYLLIPCSEDHRILKSLEQDGNNMTAFYEILMCLMAKFNDELNVSNQHELLSPIVTVLLKGARSYRPIRKYLRNQILPPLKDIYTRPEQGNTLRNHLCRLLTTPITQLRDLVAEFLFVLCKNSVNRMIKYTGYGNAAGLFAQRGLLAGGSGEEEKEFSSESEDSETEEYAEHKHDINPVTGCYEAPHPNVMADMTEEQKEYEAMKLVDLISSLMESGTIKPCVVGEDGKPKPVEHVLQLQEGLKKQQVHINDDSD